MNFYIWFPAVGDIKKKQHDQMFYHILNMFYAYGSIFMIH